MWLRMRPGMRISNLVSVKLGVAAAFVFLLQIIPIFALVGLFPIHLVLTALLSPLLQLALLSLLIESLLGLAPRALFLVPAVLYGSYFAAVWHERHVLVPQIDARLGAQNQQTVPFDPATETLHIDAGPDAREMVVAYDLPAIFDTVINQPSVVELNAPRLCSRGTEPTSTNPQWSRVFHQQQLFCVKREYRPYPRVPMLTVTMPVTVPVEDVVPRYDDTYTFERGGLTVGRFTQAKLALLSAFPQFTAGCGLFEFPAGWRCGLQFARDPFRTDGINALPRRNGSESELAIDAVRIAAMLGLQPRSSDELDAMAVP